MPDTEMMSPADPRLARWRDDTPGIDMRVHLNNAGAAFQPRSVAEAVTNHLRRETEIGGYEAADEAAERVRASYEYIARTVGAAAHNIAVVESATTAIAQALTVFDFERDDVIVTTQNDYISNQLMYLSLAQRAGVRIERAAELPSGGVDPDSVRRLVRDPRCRLVALTWIPTNSGLIQSAEAVGEVCEAAGVPYLVDACQAVAQLPVNVAQLRCDFLAATGRKFLRGPRGVGFLYVSDRALERGAFPLYVDMRGGDWTGVDTFRIAKGARRFEHWERSYALLLGLGEAARYALEAGELDGTRARALAARLRAMLRNIPGVTVLDRGTSLGAIVTIQMEGRDAEIVKKQLYDSRVNTSSIERNDAVIDMDAKRASTALRLSPHYYNTEQELEVAVAALKDVLGADSP
jgi:selenocysteine lyase/cysteine desulfurase